MVFLGIVIIIFLIIINNNINSKFKHLNRVIDDLRRKVSYLQQKSETQKTIPNQDIKRDQPIVETPTTKTPLSKPTSTKEIEKVIDTNKVPPKKPITPKPIIATSSTREKTPVPVKKKEATKKAPKKPWIETFKEKNPDLEKFIGENLINKIGILILVLGISFFVKYAIDKDWINEPARVGIGILCGSLVMGIAHKLKKNYAAFSSVLVAGAISIFYFTIYIAFNEYQLFSQTVAFVLMTIITAFSTLVSLSYNRQELAILSLIGGFAVPFMISTGEGNYIVLFTYIAILNIGILAISYFKKWKIATILAFIFTIVLFSGWYFTSVKDSDFSYSGALIFATLFYFIFSITIVLNNLKNKGVFSKIEYCILMINTFYFFGIGMVILKQWGSNFAGLFTLLLAIYNVVYATILFKKFGLDKNAIYLLLGLALTFVTLTIPIQFEGNQITIFWACEAVLLFWLSQKSKIKSFKLSAIIVQILALISLFIDWKRYFISEEFTIILNPLFISSVIVSISLFFTYWLIKNDKDVITKFFILDIKFYRAILLIVAIITTYFTGILEINYQASQFLENKASIISFPATYHFVFISVLLFLVLKLKQTKIAKGVFVASVISIITYILIFYKLPTNEIIENLNKGTFSKYAFYFHYIILGCLIYLGIALFSKTKVLFKLNPKKSKWLTWVFIFAIVYVFSNEIMVHNLSFSNVLDTSELATKFPKPYESYQKRLFISNTIQERQSQVIKIGYPILWGVFSFIFLIVGIRRQWKVLRIIALSLLGITILKLFIYDINNVSETGKIIAFILLGILILIISFVYQKIKKLVVDEAPENQDKDENI